jgi:hypothetical protein
VLDPRLNRRTVLSVGGKQIDAIPLGGAGPGLEVATVLPNGNVVTNWARTDPNLAGFPLQELDDKGRVIKSFGGEHAYRTDNASNLSRLIAARRNGEIWVGHRYANIVELYSAERTLRQSLIRTAEWFPPLGAGEDPSVGNFDRSPTPAMHGIWEDADGLLWTVARVKAPSWRPGPSFQDWRAGKGKPQPVHESFDTIIEVIDPATGKLIASLRVDPFVINALSEGYVASYREETDGTPVVDVWQVRLQRSK